MYLIEKIEVAGIPAVSISLFNFYTYITIIMSKKVKN